MLRGFQDEDYYYGLNGGLLESSDPYTVSPILWTESLRFYKLSKIEFIDSLGLKSLWDSWALIESHRH